MKVCHVNLARELRGGEHQTLALVQTLGDLNPDYTVEQTLVVRRNGSFHQHLRSLGGFELRPVRPSMLRAMSAARDADIVHVHEGRSARVGAMLSLTGTPFVMTRRIPNRPKDFFLTRWVYSRAATIACVSNHVAEVMRDYVPGTSVTTVYDCIRPISTAEHKILPRHNYGFSVAVIGEIDFSHKGQDILIPAAEILARRGSSAKFLIAGTGRDEQRLRELTEGLACFEYLGWVEDIGSLLSTADIVLHPARKEGLGSVLLEAMYFGKPIVASAVGGITEIVSHGSNGLLFEPGHAEQLANAITRLEREPQLLRQLATGSRESARQFSAKRMAQSYLGLYEQLAAPAIPRCQVASP